ncbi:Crp/Fnr family transcriptional regulator [Aureivirga sp. CE67]|uniref:Crp/Fnr family transcriptional regulator n=1 Tax=Aureivirga sp. CE67 TaxID=1788983 RepID=UPI0018CBCCD0|nr:Crp/Fnr family transcriptional regulator [Aureivirga sp. CE67]
MIFEKLQDINEPDLLELLQAFQAIMKKETFSKRQLLHEEGTVCDYLFLIQTGIARSFYYKDGKEITAHFAVENTSITAIDSFVQRKKSRYNIEVLEDSEVISISHQDLYTLLEEKPQYEKYVRMFLEQIYVDLAERIEDLLFHTAKERYDKIIENTPDLLQRVQLKHIASFIGITQETLSRIRTQV